MTLIVAKTEMRIGVSLRRLRPETRVVCAKRSIATCRLR